MAEPTKNYGGMLWRKSPIAELTRNPPPANEPSGYVHVAASRDCVGSAARERINLLGILHIFTRALRVLFRLSGCSIAHADRAHAC